MDEESFRAFYGETAQPVWSYLYHLCRNRSVADDLLQESYHRFLRAAPALSGSAHRKNYLFRIATNLARDHARKARNEGLPVREGGGEAGMRELDLRADMERACQELGERERELLWLAYVEGTTHREMAEATGLKEESIRPMLFRARHKLAALLRLRGYGTPVKTEVR